MARRPAATGNRLVSDQDDSRLGGSMAVVRFCGILVLCLLSWACSTANQEATSTPVSSEGIADSAQDSVKECVVVTFGDSLTAGYGIDDQAAWPELIQQQLREVGTPVRVVNAGVSGDTSAGGLRWVSWILKANPDIVVLCLGANDGLRGTSVAGTKRNLQSIIEQLQEQQVTVVLAGMQLPPNLGHSHVRAFNAIFPDLAEQYELSFIPFLLDGVAGKPALNLTDGIHPNEDGHQIIADMVAEHLDPVIARVIDAEQ